MNSAKDLIYTGLALCFLTATLFLSGCVTTPEPKKETDSVFFPDPPAPPRLQFLIVYTTSKDIEKKGSQFDSFLTGRKDPPGTHLIKPYGVAIQDGKIYVCDSQKTVEIFDLKNNKFYMLEGARGLGKVVQPLNINITDDGRKFVADPVRGEIVMYDADDMYVKSYGLPGQWKPVDVAHYEGLLYVVDSRNRDIKVFDIESGEKIRSLGRSNKPEENLGLPTNISIDEDGLLYITDSGRFQVVIYDRDGHQRGTIGRPGANLGHFARPRGIDIDKQGLVYVVDAAFENVQVFREDGQLLLFFGGSGRRPGDLFLPADVFIDYDNIHYFQQYVDPHFTIEYLVLVTSQFGPRLVNIYAYGKEQGRSYPQEEELMEKAQEKLEKWQEKSKENK
ncbi:MAG: hypothetical protein KAQ71_01615 [Desulfobulbaceae bacterium]|nr:hypothetical protein [Desulfobulbaceae bacterium]